MNAAPPDPDRHIALERALLCAELRCNAVYSLPRDACPACGGHSALALSLVLSSDRNRELLDGLRGLAKLLALAKRPLRKKEKLHEEPAPVPVRP